tara:strand:- start:107 stop:337 length:231 start_codon:yes stop_codon:yes gene_type:complete
MANKKLSLGQRMMKNIKSNPMMFRKLGAAGMMLTNPEKAGAAITGKDYENKSGKGMSMDSFRRIMKSLGYDYGEKE